MEEAPQNLQSDFSHSSYHKTSKTVGKYHAIAVVTRFWSDIQVLDTEAMSYSSAHL
jgi:hypothetical protein